MHARTGGKGCWQRSILGSRLDFQVTFVSYLQEPTAAASAKPALFFLPHLTFLYSPAIFIGPDSMHGRTQRDPQSLRESQTRETAHESHDAKTFYGTAPRLCPLSTRHVRADRQAVKEDASRSLTWPAAAGGDQAGTPKKRTGPRRICHNLERLDHSRS